MSQEPPSSTTQDSLPRVTVDAAPTEDSEKVKKEETIEFLKEMGEKAGQISETEMEEENLVSNSKEVGEYLIKLLREVKDDNIREIRGKGLMVGVELSIKGEGYVERARNRGLLINCTADTVVRFIPPLTITRELIRAAVEKVFTA